MHHLIKNNEPVVRILREYKQKKAHGELKTMGERIGLNKTTMYNIMSGKRQWVEDHVWLRLCNEIPELARHDIHVGDSILERYQLVSSMEKGKASSSQLALPSARNVEYLERILQGLRRTVMDSRMDDHAKVVAMGNMLESLVPRDELPPDAGA